MTSQNISKICDSFVADHQPIGIIFGTYKVKEYVFQINSLICKYNNLLIIHNLNTYSWDRIDWQEQYSDDDFSLFIKNHIYGIIDYILISAKEKNYTFAYTREGFWQKYLDFSEELSISTARELYGITYDNGEYNNHYQKYNFHFALPNNIEGAIDAECYVIL